MNKYLDPNCGFSAYYPLCERGLGLSESHNEDLNLLNHVTIYVAFQTTKHDVGLGIGLNIWLHMLITADLH